VQAQAFLDRLTAEDPERLVHVEELPARAPAQVAFPDDVPELLVSRLGLIGVTGLYAHQLAGLEALGDGHAMLATGTASGKSLVYQIATAQALLATPKATALFVFPTKALARDQLRALRALKLPQLRTAVYDGDTPQAERPLIRRNANVVLTNPDMLHLSLTAEHARWGDFLLRLSVVVIDEAHVLRGVFGSQVSMVFRRLRRLIAAHGGDPRWCLASATVGNPSELAERLTGLPFRVVEADAAPRGRKLFALWNPPIVDDESGARRSALAEAADVLTALVDDGDRAIGFTRSRRAAELLADFTRRGVADAHARDRIRAYRAGYLAEDRREIERQLAEGALQAVAATNALELGIDIGSLDAAVLTGYPGTRASMWQQAGRAGRRSDESLAVLVAQDDPLDQYLAQHPRELFEEPPEAAVVDPTNPYVLEPHLRCAAREQPLTDAEAQAFFGEAAAPALEALAGRALLKRRGDRWHDIGTTAPHRDVDIRAGGGTVYRIVRGDTGEVLGTSDQHRAFGTLHPGAVYLHQGEQYLVQELDLVRGVAVVEEADPDFYTQARDVTDIVVVNQLDHRPIGDAELSFGDVEVTNQVVGFVRKLVATNEIVGEARLALPPVRLETRAVWWTLPGRLIDRASVRPGELPGGIHGAEHCAIGMLPLVATCDRWDIGGVSTPLHADTGLTTIFVYDGYPGGAGIAERGYRSAERWLGATLERLRDCPCRDGCPSCVVSPKCGNGNEPLDKAAGRALLDAMLEPNVSRSTR
jgi:DEAD/DEAH box helicase domain-containing protein